MKIVHVFDPLEEILHYTKNSNLMSLYTWTVSTMIETYVEMRMVNESEKKKTWKPCRKETN
jgi:hypothetical protein